MNKKDRKSQNSTLSTLHSPQAYATWLKELKSKVRSTQLRAALAASRELILFYWELGGDISRKLKETNWGAKVIDQLAKDLRSEFPDIQGFSRTNLYYVKKFYEVFSAFGNGTQFVPLTGGQIENVPQWGRKTNIAPKRGTNSSANCPTCRGTIALESYQNSFG